MVGLDIIRCYRARNWAAATEHGPPPTPADPPEPLREPRKWFPPLRHPNPKSRLKGARKELLPLRDPEPKRNPPSYHRGPYHIIGALAPLHNSAALSVP